MTGDVEWCTLRSGKYPEDLILTRYVNLSGASSLTTLNAIGGKQEMRGSNVSTVCHNLSRLGSSKARHVSAVARELLTSSSLHTKRMTSGMDKAGFMVKRGQESTVEVQQKALVMIS